MNATFFGSVFLQEPASTQFEKWVHEPVPINDHWNPHKAVGSETNLPETRVKCLSGSWQKGLELLQLQALFKSAGREERDELRGEGIQTFCMNCDKQKGDKSSARGCLRNLEGKGCCVREPNPTEWSEVKRYKVKTSSAGYQYISYVEPESRTRTRTTTLTHFYVSVWSRKLCHTFLKENKKHKTWHKPLAKYYIYY